MMNGETEAQFLREAGGLVSFAKRLDRDLLREFIADKERLRGGCGSPAGERLNEIAIEDATMLLHFCNALGERSATDDERRELVRQVTAQITERHGL